jgi:transglutaminase-like putative cysteine protease
MKHFPFPKQFTMLYFIICLFFFTRTIFADDQPVWRPVSPAELQMKTPVVEADADAEALFWEVRLDDKKAGKLSYSHYVRVKIFTERGREKFSKFDIPFYKGKKVENVAARVIKTDGTIIMLSPSDIFERDILTSRKIKVKAKSFAVPGIEPGVIVEYQYSESIKDDSAGGERLIFQRDIPMQRVVYYVRPYKGSVLNFIPFNMSDVNFKETEDRFFVGTMTNVPSFKAEPYMPPDDQVRLWTLLSYSALNVGDQALSSMLGWSFFSNRYSGLHGFITKSDKKIKKIADEITAGTTSDEDKVKKIYGYVQSQIRNISYDTTLTEKQREDIDIDRIEDIVKERAGSAYHVNLLFGALASAAGLEVNLFYSSNRSEIFFNPDRVANGSFLHNAGIAVKVNDKWVFCDPGTPYLDYGDMFWHDQETVAMLIGTRNHLWVKTPLIEHGKSLSKRSGKFKLLEDGTLEGNVQFEFTGNPAISRREDGFSDSANKREEDFKEEIKSKISTAEITAMSVENFKDASKPLTYAFKVRIPNYAQKTGKRLFLQPGFFEYGSGAAFSSATRKYDIVFPYPWAEQDDIEIELPKGFALENAEAPGEVSDPSKIGVLKVEMKIDKSKNVLMYQRNFHFGGNGKIVFPVSVYQPLKNLFDAFHKADTQAVTVKQNN